MNKKVFVLTPRVSLTLFQTTYSFQIDSRVVEIWEENFTSRETMLAHAKEEISIAFGETSTDQEYDALMTVLEQINF